MRSGLLLSLVLGFGCGKGDKKPVPKPLGFDAGAQPEAQPKEELPEPLVQRPPESFDDGGDEASALATLEALPAWSAVLERHRLLARRDQSGSVFGLLVEQEGKTRLVDERIGMGSLSIPVVLPEEIELSPPARVLLWGAWHSDDSPDFVWRATQVATLSGKKKAPEFSPGLVARDKEVPEAMVLASAVSRQGGVISFRVHQRPGQVADGWLISDEAGAPPVARLLLPGEQASYGDQSRMTEAERWKLEKGHFYWLEIGRFRQAADGSLPVYHARTPPFRYSPPQDQESP